MMRPTTKPPRWSRVAALALSIVAAALAGCASVSGGASSPAIPAAQDIRQVSPEQAQRLYRVMVPLLRAMNHPLSPEQTRIGLIRDPAINAANAGGGNFYVTTGLLAGANEDQLRGVMAHEIAHEDLGHVAQMQVLGAGIDVGVQLLEQLFPGSSSITPIAGTLITRGYSRREEFEADHHAVDILRRAGYSKQPLIDALSWIQRTAGNGGGGFLSTHPATSDRIAALKG